MKKQSSKKFDPKKNYSATQKAIGYVSRKDAKLTDYQRIGFMSGLEVHQQLKTKQKLFCRCPAGIYNKHDDYHAEVIRHMRPTLSELGEYDGTALMEFKTKKEVVYRINNATTCTYEIDDTPPFPINPEALEIAIEIALISKLKIVGEVHITRKQYLDGSIPTGFQRTGIVGVEGEIQISNKKIRLFQLSVEEDSCREISDIGHTRIYKTDRLGMPLIETVTYPDCLTPDELREAADCIRFLNRSSGKVRTGIGAGREDVNVSCRGGTRVEIKGVSHNKWIPELSHNESFRQWALLNVKKILTERFSDVSKWKPIHKKIDPKELGLENKLIISGFESGNVVVAMNLPGFKGIISHFTQPGKCFMNDLSDRLKVIACIERPNITGSEDIDNEFSDEDNEKLSKLLKSSDEDSIIVFWGPEADIPTALETIEERCIMAFERIPNETRKPFEDGTTIFERVLPGADRMYPDTDSPPIPLDNEYIERLANNIQPDVAYRFKQMKNWGIPEDAFTYLLKKNLCPIIEKLVEKGLSGKYAGTFLAHRLKNVEGRLPHHPHFNYWRIVDMFDFLAKNKYDKSLSILLLPTVYQHPNLDFESILTGMKFKRKSKEELIAPVNYLMEKFKEIKVGRRSTLQGAAENWIMGQLQKQALGNISMSELRKNVNGIVESN